MPMPFKLKFDVKFGKTFAKAGEKYIQKVLKETLKDTSELLFEKSQENLKSYGAVDTGTLMGSGFIEMNHEYEWVVGYSAPYSIFVNYGTKGRMPPVEPILEWVKRNLAITGKGKQKQYELKARTGRRIRKAEDEQKKALSVAWAVAKSIEKDGTEPRPFFTEAVEYTRGRMEDIFNEAVKRAGKEKGGK